MFIEVNLHTAEKRQHDAVTLVKRAKAIGRQEAEVKALLRGDIPEIKTEHSVLRRMRIDDSLDIPCALETGAWGKVGA